MNETNYDIAIGGGGLAGLAASILLAKKGHRVVLLEKEKYPFHKVCGEYVSMESWNFLQQLGLPLGDMQLPKIHKLQLSAPSGKTFETKLGLGGFGISRFKLDASLAALARAAGVHLLDGSKIDYIGEDNSIHYSNTQGKGIIRARISCAAWGKRSNIDLKWNRSFVHQQDRRLQNFVGVKYHLQAARPRDTIALHNFRDGYAGFSAVEGDTYCFCYMTRAENLRQYDGIPAFEKGVLYQNPHIRKLLEEATTMPGFPVTISQISFRPKPAVEKGWLMMGDTAGMIAPLCGNGMSIAMHTALLAACLCDDHLRDRISKKELEEKYALQWKTAFGGRLWRGRLLQRFFGSNFISNSFVQAFRTFPFMAAPVLRATHGKPF